MTLTVSGLLSCFDAATVMATARRLKTPGEITCLEVASAIAEAALSALEDALQPDITERELRGVYHERVARRGAPWRTPQE